MRGVLLLGILDKRLTQLREEKDWTKTYVAKQLGLNNLGTYANWEYGTREPDSEMITKIADLYDVTTDYLLGQTNEKVRPQIEKSSVGENIVSHFRLNTANMDVDDIEELEEELTDYMEFLIKKAKEKKDKRKKE